MKQVKAFLQFCGVIGIASAGCVVVCLAFFAVLKVTFLLAALLGLTFP